MVAVPVWAVLAGVVGWRLSSPSSLAGSTGTIVL
jgi:hypothetical protein